MRLMSEHAAVLPEDWYLLRIDRAQHDEKYGGVVLTVCVAEGPFCGRRLIARLIPGSLSEQRFKAKVTQGHDITPRKLERQLVQGHTENHPRRDGSGIVTLIVDWMTEGGSRADVGL